MTDSAPITVYRREYIKSFEQRYSRLKIGCVRETMIEGQSAVFMVSGSGAETAVTRGANGLIPYKNATNTQNTCTLKEAHGPFRQNGFDLFKNQGDQRRILMMSSQDVLNRDIDQSIIDQLDTATQTTGAAAPADLRMVSKAKTILGNAGVNLDEEEKIFAAVTPAFKNYLQEVTEFSSGEYVEVKPFNGPSKAFWRWNGVNWIEHIGLTGKGGASEKCYMWHTDAVGHAANIQGEMVHAGYNDEQDYSYTRASCWHNAKKLQNTGIVQMLHDGSALAA